METFLLKADQRSSKIKDAYSVYNCYERENYSFPVTDSFSNLVSIQDCEINPNMGVFPHKHENMELITILISGILVQKNSRGETYELKPGEAQLTKTGTGISHFEYNKCKSNVLSCLQFCIIPKSNYLNPLHRKFSLPKDNFGLQKVISSGVEGLETTQMFQDFHFYYGRFNQDSEDTYKIKNKKSGVIIVNVSGEIEVNGEQVEAKDTLMIRNSSNILIKSKKNATFFLMEI